MRTTHVAGCIWQMMCMITCSFGNYAIVSSRFGRLRGATGVSSNLFDTETVPYVKFHGVPYAEPPIGERRFMPPVKRSTRWQGTLDARKPGPICPQVVTEETPMEEKEFEQEMVYPTDDPMVSHCKRC